MGMASQNVVIVYSRSGRTKKIGEEIAHELGSDLVEIKEVKSRRGIFGFLRSGMEAMRKMLPPIQAPQIDLASYKTVIIGTPIWASNISSPVRSFLVNYCQKIPSVAFFCTKGGKDFIDPFTEMGALVQRAPVATLALSEEEVKKGFYKASLIQFLKQIQ
jgi:flavodoxin